MRKLLLFCTFIMLLSCKQKINEPDCLKFHSGKFRYVADNYSGAIVERNDSVQTETNLAANRYFEGNIEWLSDCEYILILYKAKAKYGEEMLNKPFYATIDEVKGNVATIKYTFDGNDRTIKMEKIE